MKKIKTLVTFILLSFIVITVLVLPLPAEASRGFGFSTMTPDMLRKFFVSTPLAFVCFVILERQIFERFDRKDKEPDLKMTLFLLVLIFTATILGFILGGYICDRVFD